MDQCCDSSLVVGCFFHNASHVSLNRDPIADVLEGWICYEDDYIIS